MVYRFHSVMEIKRQEDFTPVLETDRGKYYKVTVSYDIAGQRLHQLEINWLSAKIQIELILKTLIFLVPTMVFTILPSLIIGGILKNFETALIILGLSSLAGSYWYSRIDLVEKKMKALIRLERGLEPKNEKYALVPEKKWAKWLLKLKSI